MKIQQMIWGNIKLKRKIAALLCMVMTTQIVLSGPLPVMAEEVTSESTDTWADFDLIGEPEEAFDHIQASVETKVTDNQTVALKISMQLNDFYTMGIYEDATDGDLKSPDEFEPYAIYTDYDDYLNKQPDDVLPSISFSCVLDGGDALLLTGALEGKMDAGSQGIIGSYKIVKENDNIVFRANIDKRVYALLQVLAVQNIEIDANPIYTPGSEITATPGDSDSDIKLTITPNGNPDTDDQNYIATKTSEMIENSREIVYTISVVASNSNAAYEEMDDVEILDVEDDDVEVASPSVSQLNKVMRKSAVSTAPPRLTRSLLGLNKVWAAEAAKTEMTETKATEAETTEAETTEAETTEAETTEAETKEVETTETETKEVETAETETTEVETTEVETTETDTTEAETLPEESTTAGVLPMPESELRVRDTDGLASPSDAYEKVISDQIPEGLDVTKVEIRINTKEEQWILLDDQYYTLREDGLLTYKIGAGPENLQGDLHENSPFVETVDLKIYTQMNDELYNQYMMSGKKFEQTFSNKAQLKDEGGTKTLTNTNRVENTLILEPFLQKEGEAINIANGEYKWTLTVNSLFSNDQATLYAIDHIENIGKTHDIIPGKGVTLEKDNMRKPIDIRVINGIDGPKLPYTLEQATDGRLRYADMNITQILKFLNDNGIAKDHEDAIVYTYATTPSSDENTIYDAIMLIPLSPNYINGVTHIEYYTDATVGIPDDAPGLGSEITLLNEAKLAWRWLNGGPGPGTDTDFGGATIDKDIDTYRHLVNKSADDVTEGTTITWNFEINQMGIPVKTLQVTDSVDTSIQKFVGLGEGEALVLTAHKVNSSGTGDLTSRTVSMGKAGDQGDHYTFVADEESGEQTFTLYLEDLEPNVYYTCSVQTEVQESALYEQNDIEITNDATIDATFATGSPVSEEISAETTIKNPLINKEAINFGYDPGYNYNYDDNTVKWNLEINSNRRTITEASIVDTLPDGVTLATISDATYGNNKASEIKQLSEKSWQISFDCGMMVTMSEVAGTIDINSKSYAKNTVNFAFAQEQTIKDVFKVEYTTFVTDDYRRDIVKSNDTTTLTNTAELKGKIGGATITNGTDRADHIINPQPNKKSGQYNESTDYLYEDESGKKAIEVKYLSWELYVNRTNADFKGGIVSDTLKEKQHLQLYPKSMKVYKVALDKEGNEDKTRRGEPIASFGTDGFEAFTPCDDEGFIYKIPDSYSKDTLLFTFDTFLVDNANANEMTNEASIETAGGIDSTGNVQADGAKRFSVDSYAQAKGMFFIKVYKTTEHKEDIQKFPLAGAEFELTKLKKTSGASGTSLESWEVDNDHPWTKTKVTNAGGSINFMFLQEGIMYRLKETKAPDGYIVADRVWYIVPKNVGTDYPNDGLNAEKMIEVSLNASEDQFNAVTIENTVVKEANNKIIFKKLGHGGQILPGVTFTLSHKNLTPRKATSDDEGWVTFKELDPLPAGEWYTIKETHPKGYKPAPELSVYVTSTGADSFNVVVKQGKTTLPPVTDTDGPYYVINNTAYTGDGSFQKVDQNGDPIKGIKFNVTRRGDGGSERNPVVIDVGGATDYESYFPMSSITSDDDGIVAFTDFPYGDYRFTEVKTENADLIDTTTPVVVDIKIGEDSVKVKGTGGSYSELGNDYKLTNELKYGYVQVNKVLSENHSTKIANATFEIYHGTGTTNLAMTVKTDASGNFAINSDTGGYITKGSSDDKFLIAGQQYTLQETAVKGDLFTINPNQYTFTVPTNNLSGDKFAPKTIHIGKLADGTIGSTETETEAKFENVPIRGTVELKKYDADVMTKELKTAEFDVYIKNGNSYTPVAALAYDIGAGCYKLAEKSGVSATNGVIPYLHKSQTDAYELLKGTYYIKETKAPTDLSPDGTYYPEPDSNLSNRDTWQFAISTPEQKITEVYTPGTTTVKPITNKIKKYSFSVEKYAQTWNTDGTIGTIAEYTKANGFKFNLAGTGANGAAYSETVTTANNTGAKFKDIPIGTYTLTETDVPAGYRWGEPNADTDAQWSVTKMLPIAVTVTAEGVTFKRSDASLPSDLSEPAGTDWVSAATTTTAAIVNIYNTYKVGSIVGEKIGTGSTKNVSTPLSGAVFGLYQNANDANSLVQTMSGAGTVTMLGMTGDDSGKIKFANIPYGKYYVKEISAPAGYTMTGGPYEVIVNAENSSITTSSTAIENKAILRDIKLKKVDQNGATLPNTTLAAKFTIEQRKVDGVLQIPTTIHTAPATASNDANGDINIKNLAYGTYWVQEDADTSHLVDGKLASFQIVVEKGDDANTTKITVSDIPTQTFNTFGPTKTNTYSITKANTSTEIYDFSANYDVKNWLKYASVAINKEHAEQVGENYVSVNPLHTLAGATFKFYRAGADETKFGDSVLSLTTMPDGTFPAPGTDGMYTDAANPQKKFGFVAGNYIAKEVTAPSGYECMTKPIPFTVKDTGGEAITLTYDGTTPGVDKTSTPGAFYNIPSRGTVKSFDKVDSEKSTTKVNGAVFGLIPKEGTNTGKVVAFMTDQMTPGTYALVEKGEIEGVDELLEGKNLSYVAAIEGRSYVWNQETAKVPKLAILAGTYQLVELKTEAGYETNSLQDVSFTVTHESEAKLTGSINGNVTNTLKAAEIIIQKYVETFIKNENGSSTTTYKPLTDTPSDVFEFTLKGTAKSGKAIEESRTIGSEKYASGKAVFKNIPVSDATGYTLSEEQYPANYKKAADSIIMVHEDGTVSYKGETNADEPFEIKNDLIRHDIYGKKVTMVGDIAHSVENVTFGLYRATDDSDTGLRAISNSEGTFKFVDVPWESTDADETPTSYYIKEVETPAGYVVNSNQYLVLVGKNVTTNSTTETTDKVITETNRLLIKNDPIKVSLKVMKVDQNGNPLKNGTLPVELKLTRDPADSENPLNEHLSVATASNADDGSVTFENLVYGTYKLTEEDNDHVTDWNTIDVKVVIQRGDGGNTEVMVGDKTIKEAAVNGLYDFSQGDNIVEIKNEVDYGLVQINKIIGSVNENGTLTPVKDADGNNRPLAGAVFNVYPDANGDGVADEDEVRPDKIMLTLVTGKEGTFKIDSDYKYLDCSDKPQPERLIMNERYLLKEAAAPLGYAASTAVYPFKTSTINKEVIYVGADSTDNAINLTSEIRQGIATDVFPNGELYRGTIELEKYDHEELTRTLSGAEFDIHTIKNGTDVKVARLLDKEIPALYKLALGVGSGYELENAVGQRYLHENVRTLDELKLLPGEYYIVETKEPNGYVEPSADERWYFTLESSEGAKVVNDDLTNVAIKGSPKVLDNQIAKQDVNVQKWLQNKELGTPTYHTATASDALEDITFTLEGKTANAGETNDFTAKKMLKRDGDDSGTVTFKDVPSGMYTLTETVTPDGYLTAKPVTVKVTKDGVEIKTEGSTDFVATTEPIEVQNNLIKGSIKGTKRQTDGKTLEGATMGLFLPGTTEFTEANLFLGLKAESDTAGSFLFEDVFYGDYIVAEIDSPEGYHLNHKTRFHVTIRDEGVTVAEGIKEESGTAGAAAEAISEAIQFINDPIRVSLTLMKVDQNKDPLKHSTVPVVLKLTNTAAPHDNLTELASTAATASNAEDGRVTFENLVCGTYQLTEEDNSPLVTNAGAVKATVTIKENTTTGEVEVTLNYNETAKAISAPLNPNGVSVYDFAGEAYRDVRIVNEAAYGLIQINKVVGSVNTDGTLTPVRDGSTFRKLAGARFQVYTTVEVDGAASPSDVVLTLVTGEDGTFKVDAQNQYLDADGKAQPYRLLFGEKYLLKEIAAPEGYVLHDTLYPFDMTRIEKSGDTIYIGADPADTQIDLGSGSDVGDMVATEPNQNGTYLFPNGEAYRGVVKLKKYDTEDKRTLDGAVFDVFDISGDKAAKLTDSKTKGTYLLEAGDAGYVKDNPVGQSYLYQEDGAYKLLPGSYYIVETKAPAGYLLPSEQRWYFQIDSAPGEEITNTELFTQTTGGTVKLLENQIAKYDVAIQKYIQEALQEITYHTARMTDELAGIEFQLTGVTVNGDDYTDTKVLASDMNAQGIVTFDDVPAGIYMVTELHVPEQYQVPAPIHVVVGVNGVQVNNSPLPVTTPTRVDNDLKRGAIQGKKHRVGDAALEGATMGIFPAGTTEFTEENLYAGLTSISDKEGIFRFESIIYGDYVIAELKAPSGYRLNTTVSYQVKITEHGKVVTTGDKQESGVITAPGADITIVNQRKPSGGGGIVPPGAPGITPTEPEVPTSPSVPETSETPEEPTTPGIPELPTIPADPNDPGRPNIPPGTDVEVHYPNDPYGPPLYEGPYDPNQRYPQIPPGVYELITIDDERIPLASFLFTIDENGVPLAVPKVGDFSVSTTILLVILATSLLGVAIIRRRKKEDYE